MNEKSFELYSRERASGERFDYFICSVAGALFAYIGQTYTPHTFDNWYSYLTPSALFALTICFGIGLWTISISKDVTTLNKEIVLLLEESTRILELLQKSDCQVFDNPKQKQATRAELIEKVENNRISMDEMREDAMGKIERANWLNFFRNIFLIVGFLLILASKILQPYFAVKLF
jgi:DMSO reductase anchor subunit